MHSHHASRHLNAGIIDDRYRLQTAQMGERTYFIQIGDPIFRNQKRFQRDRQILVALYEICNAIPLKIQLLQSSIVRLNETF